MLAIRSLILAAALVLTIGFASAGALNAQTAPQPATHPVIINAPSANAADVASIDAIITALYDVISGPAGQARDWNRMRSLFIPGGRLMPTAQRPGGGTAVRLMEVNDYIALSGSYLESVGFTETEIARRTEQYGNIAHVFSTYAGHMETESTTIRGINSIQLINDGSRWWIISVYWEAERPDNPLPEHYLSSR
jgi:hypothetical protein